MVRKILPDIVYGQNVFELSANATARDAARGMADQNVHSVLVTDSGKLVGIFTSTDLVTKVVAAGLKPSKTALADVMTPDPQTVSPGFNAIDALRRMHEGRYRHLPVVKDDELIGFLSVRTILGYLHRDLISG